MSSKTVFQAGGGAGVKQTLTTMARLTNQAVDDPNIRSQAAEHTYQFRGDKQAQMQALLSWTRAAIRYVPDPAGLEMLHGPALIARAIAEKRFVYGDCDELSMYLGTLLKAVGMRPIYRAVGYNGFPWSHVYVVVNGARLDPTRREWLESGLVPHRETSSLEVPV